MLSFKSSCKLISLLNVLGIWKITETWWRACTGVEWYGRAVNELIFYECQKVYLLLSKVASMDWQSHFGLLILTQI